MVDRIFHNFVSIMKWKSKYKSINDGKIVQQYHS